MVPQGSVSVEVYADRTTKAEAMLRQGKEMFGWIPNAHIKFPTSAEGLKAASIAIREGMRVNMTLCFTQSQAAAVYAATRGARKGQVFVSPFIGRLDDRGENGMDLIANILRMYAKGRRPRGGPHREREEHRPFLCAIKMGSDIITVPFRRARLMGQEGTAFAGRRLQV